MFAAFREDDCSDVVVGSHLYFRVRWSGRTRGDPGDSGGNEMHAVASLW